MRQSLVAIHAVALAIWLGSLAMSFALAATLFGIARPVCAACTAPLLPTNAPTGPSEPPRACTSCGALVHGACVARGCGLEHEGSHELRGSDSAPATRPRAGTATWTRVRLLGGEHPPERRLLWRLDGASAALDAGKGELPGACFELPRAAVGDALARAFQLGSLLSVTGAIFSLLTVLLTPPGGALRLFRALALVLGLGLAAWGLALGEEIGTLRLDREAPTGATAANAGFGKAHGLSSVARTGEALLVLVACALATIRRPETPSAAAVRGASPPSEAPRASTLG